MSTGRPVSGYLLLAAAAAGSTDAQAVHEALAVLAADAPTELWRADEPDALEAALDALDGRRLVIAGGDGTVHLVVAALLARGLAASTTLGLVPLGTGNDLAHGLGLPLDPAAAARRVTAGRVRALDVAAVGEHVAVNAAHTGLGVAAARRAARLKPVLGSLAYRLAGLWAGAVEEGLRASVHVDGEAVAADEQVMLVALMNGPTVGGGSALCPAADPGDGLLDVLVVRDRGRGERARFGVALQQGDHLRLPGVIHLRGRKVRVQAAVPRWNIDGELEPVAPAFDCTVQPAAWRLVA